MEELGYDLDENKLKFIKVLENLFEFEGHKVHELFFVYKYLVDDKEYDDLKAIKNNKDNDSTYFEFININDIDKVNLLPLTIIDMIRELH